MAVAEVPGLGRRNIRAFNAWSVTIGVSTRTGWCEMANERKVAKHLHDSDERFVRLLLQYQLVSSLVIRPSMIFAPTLDPLIPRRHHKDYEPHGL